MNNKKNQNKFSKNNNINKTKSLNTISFLKIPKSLSFRVNNSKTLQAGWNKIWFSQTASGSTYGLSNYSTNWGIVTSSLSDSITIKLRNIKGEIVSSNEVIQPTSFIANNNDLSLDSNIIYDSSGYENNGEIINGVTILSDTPRYEACTHMSATNQKIKISNFPTSGFGNSYSFE